MENLELHGERAALRGNPSFVWRAGQNRRLDMILQWGMRSRQEGLWATNGVGAPQGVIAGPGLGRVLVDGCGVGMYVKALLPFAQEVAGIDIEWEHLEIAAGNVPEAQLDLAACEALPYPQDSFDLVLSHEVLEHVNDDRQAVAEMVRVLRPGGRAVIFVPNRLYPFETHGHYWRGEYHFGNTPLINYLPDPLAQPAGAARAGIHGTGAAPSLSRPARAHLAPHADLSRLRQHRGAQSRARPVGPPHHLCAGEHAADGVWAQPFSGGGEGVALHTKR